MTEAAEAPECHALFSAWDAISLYHFWTSPLPLGTTAAKNKVVSVLLAEVAQWPTHVINEVIVWEILPLRYFQMLMN